MKITPPNVCKNSSEVAKTISGEMYVKLFKKIIITVNRLRPLSIGQIG
jgi:hypothetical protein